MRTAARRSRFEADWASVTSRGSLGSQTRENSADAESVGTKDVVQCSGGDVEHQRTGTCPTNAMTSAIDYGGLDTPEFLAMNPNGTIPVLRDDDGEPLWESSAILRYLANRYGRAPYWPDNLAARTHIDKWAEWSKINVALNFSRADFLAGRPHASEAAGRQRAQRGDSGSGPLSRYCGETARETPRFCAAMTSPWPTFSSATCSIAISPSKSSGESAPAFVPITKGLSRAPPTANT